MRQTDGRTDVASYVLVDEWKEKLHMWLRQCSSVTAAGDQMILKETKRFLAFSA